MSKFELGRISFRYMKNTLLDEAKTGLCKWYQIINVSLWCAVIMMSRYEYCEYSDLVEMKRFHELAYRMIKERKEKADTFTDIEQGEEDFRRIYDAIKAKFDERKSEYK